MRSKKLVTATMCASVIVLLTGTLCAQKDPGPRAGTTGTTCTINGVTVVGTGCPVAGLSPDELRFFNNAAARFNSPEAVANGLGPTFNGNSCGMCHSQPAEGGTSPSTNPQVPLASLMGATNTVPSFVRSNGPIREARFPYFYGPNGSPDRDSPDGGVHDLFTIAGRSDAPGCNMAQDNFAKAVASHNVIFRIPTPVFGGGLIDAIDDATLLTNLTSTFTARRALGIHGRPNRSGNDGTITKFGWKAQNKSLLMFAQEAYSVEVGETNMMFPQKRGFGGNPPPSSCVFNSQPGGAGLPEDFTNYLPNPSSTELVPSDDDSFATFMRFLDQPTPACTGTGCSASIQNGNAKFSAVGCALCHTPSLTTTPVSAFAPAALAGVQANLFSDLMLHRMGEGLQDNISQGLAQGNEFRTAPLWGVGQRVYFLHDGRTSDLLQAIQQHQSRGSEANQVIQQFNQLSPSDQQDILNFLRSL
jgi:CxxC motif-containing protein (DUF1111 family)